MTWTVSRRYRNVGEREWRRNQKERQKCALYERNWNEIYIFVSQEPTNVPLKKDDLVSLAAILFLELKIVHGPATFLLRQICEELVIIARRRLFVHDDLGLLVVEPEDDVLGRLFKFQRLIINQTLWVYGYAGRLVCVKAII